MKLDINLIRDILLYLEDTITITDKGEIKGVSVHNIADKYKDKYEKGQIIYTCLRLKEGGYIIASFQYASNRLSYSEISAITYEGHELLNLIRDNSIWGKTKKTAASIGSEALSVIKDVAKNIISDATMALINQTLLR